MPEPTRYWTSKSRSPAVWVWRRGSYPLHVQLTSSPERLAPVTRAIAGVWSSDSVMTAEPNVRRLDER